MPSNYPERYKRVREQRHWFTRHGLVVRWSYTDRSHDEFLVTWFTLPYWYMKRVNFYWLLFRLAWERLRKGP